MADNNSKLSWSALSNQETELTPEQKYLQMGREMEFGMDDTDRESVALPPILLLLELSS